MIEHFYSMMHLLYDHVLTVTVSQLNNIIFSLLRNATDVHPNPRPDINQELCISHLNVQSLPSEISPNPSPYDQKYIKVDEIFKQQVSDRKADLITISESWLDNSIPDTDITLANYVIYRADRNRHGGGVMVYANETLPTVRRQDLETNDTESIWLEIRLPCGNILVGTYYRPPGANEICYPHCKRLQIQHLGKILNVLSFLVT
jgi:hypothetical protein